VNDRAVADGHVGADRGGGAAGQHVQSRVILDVRAAADADRKDVAAHDRVEPQARVGADLDVTDHDRARGDEDRRIDARRHPAKRRDHGRVASMRLSFFRASATQNHGRSIHLSTVSLRPRLPRATGLSRF
jgi:hypothetical protein